MSSASACGRASNTTTQDFGDFFYFKKEHLLGAAFRSAAEAARALKAPEMPQRVENTIARNLLGADATAVLEAAMWCVFYPICKQRNNRFGALVLVLSPNASEYVASIESTCPELAPVAQRMRKLAADHQVKE